MAFIQTYPLGYRSCLLEPPDIHNITSPRHTVYLAGRGTSYWLNLLTVAICCNATLLASLSLLAPVVETHGKYITANLWQFTPRKSAPGRPTLFLFPNDFLFVRRFAEQENEEERRQLTEDVETPKSHGPFRRFMASIATSARPHSTHYQIQLADSVSNCAIARQESVSRRPVSLHNVGWRTGRLSGNVDMLTLQRRDNKLATNKTSTKCVPMHSSCIFACIFVQG